MAIQERRGAYGNFDPTKMSPGEWAIVLSGDTSATDGRSVYVCFAAGTVKRMSTADETAALIATAKDEIEQDFQEMVQQAIDDTNAATKAAKEQTALAKTATENADAATKTATDAAGTATKAAGTATDAAKTATDAAGTATGAAKTATDAAGTATAAAETATEAAGGADSAATKANEAAEALGFISVKDGKIQIKYYVKED